MGYGVFGIIEFGWGVIVENSAVPACSKDGDNKSLWVGKVLRLIRMGVNGLTEMGSGEFSNVQVHLCPELLDQIDETVPFAGLGGSTDDKRDRNGSSGISNDKLELPKCLGFKQLSSTGGCIGVVQCIYPINAFCLQVHLTRQKLYKD